MAIDSFAPEFFLQELSPLQMYDYPWVAMAGTPGLGGAGNQLTWPDLEGSIATEAYDDSSNTDLDYTLMSDEVYQITVADFRATDFAVTDIEAAQRMPSAMANGMSQSMREQMIRLQDIIRTAYRRAPGDTPAGRLGVTTARTRRGASTTGFQNLSNQAFLSVGVAAVSGKQHWDSAAARAIIYNDILEAGEFMAEEAWSPDMGKPVVAICPIQMMTQLTKMLTVDRINMGEGELVDSAWTGRPNTLRINGIEFHEDKLAGTYTLTGAVAAGNLRMDFLWPGQSVKYISQPITVEMFRDPGKFRTRGRSLRLNGAGQDAARYLYSKTYQLTTT